jgi:hypothetical protein
MPFVSSADSAPPRMAFVSAAFVDAVRLLRRLRASADGVRLRRLRFSADGVRLRELSELRG